MNHPKTDDFRLARDGQRIVVTFTPTGQQFEFQMHDADHLEAKRVRPPRSDAPEHDEGAVERMATDLVRIFLGSSSRT